MKGFAVILVVLLIGVASIFGGQAMAAEGMAIRIISGKQQAVVVLYDNPVSRDFVSLLPMTLTFQDYAQAEKGSNLPRKLTTRGGVPADDVEGDFTYYAPWGNLAVFYRGFGKGPGLFTLGRIESGKEWLAGQHKDFTGQIERVDRP